MPHTFYRMIIPALFLALPAGAASAASFSLPSDAAVKVEEFIFPESASHVTERNLPAMLRGYLAEKLQQAGLMVDFFPPAPQTEGSEIPAGEKEDAPITVTPITENGGEKTPETAPAGEPAPAAEPSGPEKTGTAEKRHAEAEETPGKNSQLDIIQGVFASQAVPVQPGYTVSGHVTLLRENIGTPARIGGEIGVRAESILHCVYRVEDASGKVLISATASASAARLVSDTRNIDAVIANLHEKVVRSVAEKIASDLSGTDAAPPAPLPSPGKSYYEDSPGKRLKQN